MGLFEKVGLMVKLVRATGLSIERSSFSFEVVVNSLIL